MKLPKLPIAILWLWYFWGSLACGLLGAIGAVLQFMGLRHLGEHIILVAVQGLDRCDRELEHLTEKL